MLALAAFVLAQQGRQLENLKFDMPDAIFPGQREVVLGPLPYKEMQMSIIYSKEKDASFDMKGINPPAWTEFPEGFIKWSVKPDTFAEKPCMVVRLEGVYLPNYRFKFKGGTREVRQTLDIRGVSQWWVAPDGTILRQFEQRTDSRGVRTANCTYLPDEISVQADNFGKRSAMSLFPADMDKLQLQFKPMIVDGKVVMRDKEYLVYDPFTSGFVKRSAHVSSAFRGNFLQLPFEGMSVDFEGLIKGKLKAYISKEGDLVKMDLPNDLFIILSTIPPGKGG